METKPQFELVKRKKKGLALMAIIGVNFLWGLDFIAIEYMMGYLSPAMFTLIRLGIGVLVLVPLCLILRRGIKIHKGDRLRVFLAGAVGMAIYFSIESLGTGLTSASFSSLIMATVPVFGMLGDWLFFGNRITLLKIICILASIFGVWLLVRGEPMGINLLGFFAMLAAAMLWAFYIIYTKSLFDRYDLLTLLTGLFLAGFIMQIPIAACSQALFHVPVNLTATGIALTVGTALICIIAGEFAYVYAIGKLSPTTSSAFENVLPVTAVIFSFFFFGKMLTAVQIIGAVIILSAVTVIALTDGIDG